MSFAFPSSTASGADHLALLSDGYNGADPAIVGAFNKRITGALGGLPSDRDPASFPDTNSSVTIEATMNSRFSKLLDVNQNEVVFAWTKDRLSAHIKPQTQGAQKPPQRLLGLSAFNDYLKSDEGIMLYGAHQNAERLKEDWAVLGVLQGKVKRGGTNSHSYYVDGRAVMPDITCWARGTGNAIGLQAHVCQPGDWISLCLRRVTLVQKDMRYLRDQDQTYHWVVVPMRHRSPVPSPVHYNSVGFMATPANRYVGDYWQLGFVRMTLGVNPINSTRVVDQCYEYLFNRTPNSDSHIRAFNDLPQLEIYLYLCGRRV